MRKKTRETISITLPINAGKILDEMAGTRYLNRSKLIEMLIRGKIKIPEEEWKQWETWYKQYDKNKEKE